MFPSPPPYFVAVVWGKLVLNSAINPLTALLNLTNGRLLQSDQGRRLVEAVLDESVAVAKKRGVRLPYRDPLEKVHLVLNRLN